MVHCLQLEPFLEETKMCTKWLLVMVAVVLVVGSAKGVVFFQENFDARVDGPITPPIEVAAQVGGFYDYWNANFSHLVE